MHQDGFILVFRDVLYDDDPPSVGPRGGYNTPRCCNDNSRKRIIKNSIFFHVLVG